VGGNAIVGNITADYFIGNGSQLTGIASSYGNANVVTLGESGWAGNIIPASNLVYSLGNATNRWSDLFLSGNLNSFPQSVGVSLSAGASKMGSGKVVSTTVVSVLVGSSTGAATGCGAGVGFGPRFLPGTFLTAGFFAAGATAFLAIGFTTAFFTAAFALECFMKLIAHSSHYFSSAWNKFDFFVVSASFLDIVMANMSANSLKVIRVGP
jgi:hypothetical protein